MRIDTPSMARIISRMATLMIVLLPVALLLHAAPAPAHPHVFVDATPTLVIGKDGLSGIRHHWLFDDMFTAALLSDLGLTPADLKTPKGQEAIRDGGFANLKNVGYFTIVQVDGQRLKPGQTSDFHASVSGDNRLIYDFFLALDIPVQHPATIRITICDREYYADMLLLKDQLGIDVGGPFSVSHSIAPAPDLAYWGGFVIPQAITLRLEPAGSTMPAPASRATRQADISEPQPGSATPSLLQRLMGQVVALQKAIKKKLTALATDIRTNPLGKGFWMFLLLSFLYGGVHAIGPGHGKTVVCSYFLARPGSLWLGAVMGHAITFVHVASATIVVMGAYWLLGSGMGGFQSADKIIQPASYALLSLVGLGLCVAIIRDLRKGGLLRGAACPVDAGEVARSEHMGSVLLVSFVTGVVPCPGAAVILAFAVGLNIVGAGIAAMLAMALGMGLTTTLFAWAAVSARGLTLRISGKNRTLFNRVYAFLSICGALAIALFGVAMFLGSI